MASKASKRQEDIVRQERARAAEQAATLKAEQSQLANLLRERLLGSVAPTELETDRISRLQQSEPEYQRLLQTLATGLQPVESVIPYEDTFDPQFELLRDRIRSQAAQRGLVGSGLELENLGRAGIDLAIKQAQERQNNRALNEQLASNRRAELGNFLSGQQSLVDTQRGRQIAGEQNAAVLPANIMNQTNLQANQDISATNARNFALEAQEIPYLRSRDDANQQAMGQLLGSGVGLAASFIPGIGPIAGPMLGNIAGSAVGGGGQTPSYSYGTPPFIPQSGADMRSTYRYGSKRPSLSDRLMGGNW